MAGGPTTDKIQDNSARCSHVHKLSNHPQIKPPNLGSWRRGRRMVSLSPLLISPSAIGWCPPPPQSLPHSVVVRQPQRWKTVRTVRWRTGGGQMVPQNIPSPPPPHQQAAHTFLTHSQFPSSKFDGRFSVRPSPILSAETL
ncbi:hypothetical protein niasHT_023159 [Heterodera trifolii]|uniref:Uncharacterized protein n=1 Tax=Heterodera trifolii TaxID=157864 RepID=A0ABD2JDX4_9BILA